MDNVIELLRPTKPDKFPIEITSIDVAADADKVPFFSKPNNVLAQMLGMEKQADLAYGTALFVSQGGNKNGFYFTHNLLLGNYKTAILKPINVGHNQEFIIGVVYDVALSKKGDVNSATPEFNFIDDNKIKFDQDKGYSIEGYKGEVDVWIHFALFRAIYPGVVETLREDISGDINSDHFFISMEIYYDDYKYLWDEDESTAFERTTGNIYLDDYIGRTVEGKRLFRMYTGPITFGGGGIVGNPANSRSVLADIAHRDVAHSNQTVVKDGDGYKIHSLQSGSSGSTGSGTKDKDKGPTNFQNHSKEEIAMPELDISSLKQQIDSNIEARIKTLQTEQRLDAAQATNQAQKEEITSLTKKLEDVSAASDAAIQEGESALKEATDKAEETQTKLDEASKQLEEANKKIEELEKNQMSDEDKAELSEYRKHKLANERLADLASKGVVIPDDKKEDVLKKLGDYSEEQYAAYADALSVNPDKANTTDKSDGKADDKNKDTNKDKSSDSVDDKSADKILSNASGNPDDKLNQDKASSGAATNNRFNALRGLTGRTKNNPRGM